jgi:hypothetical protein
MSNLTGQAIQNTYPGLLNLQTATTGITSSLQAIQDGLGNNTGLQISTTQLESQNILSFVPFQSRYFGSGFSNTAPAQYGSGTQNVILATPFYDNGNYSYSAMSVNVTTITSTSDTVEFAIYTPQLINPNGLFPHTPIISGLTCDTTTLGVKTISFPSNISFSGYGAGLYWLVYKISNGGVQPTVRFGASGQATLLNQILFPINGQVLGFTTNTYQNFNRYNNTPNNLQVYTSLTTFDNPYSNTINSQQSTTTSITGVGAGVLLHTVGA